jgi:endonuclease YncB( thermonuclease family)
MRLGSTVMRIAALAFLLFTSAANAETITGRVIGVTDGDTVTVLDGENQQHKIRLSGIDAPEKSQEFGNKSKQALSDCAYDQHVTVEYTKRDRYKRIVGKVVVSGRDCNLEQIRSGMAWHYKKYAGEQSAADRQEYADSELVAKASKIGLWSDPNAMPPWDYRKRK